jgi:hypothetical protein
MYCSPIREPEDPDGWTTAYLCSSVPLGLRFSSAGPIEGLECLPITEDEPEEGWSDNSLCSSCNLDWVWSAAGPVEGKTCVAWRERGDAAAWRDNFLCYDAKGALPGDLVTPDRTYVAPTTGSVLSTLRPGHPRLVLTPEVLHHLKGSASQPAQAENFAKLEARVAGILACDTMQEPSGAGCAAITNPQVVGEQLVALALAARLFEDGTSGPRFTRARELLLAAADWNGWRADFALLHAAIVYGVAIAYDWLYTDLSPEERAKVGGAINSKGLAVAKSDWIGYRNNWVTVCGGGFALGALAIADEQPSTAASWLTKVIGPMRNVGQFFGPDGGYIEGMMYSNYALRPTALMAFAALETALGTDFGVTNSAGLAEHIRWRLYMQSPNGKWSPGFADDYTQVGIASFAHWFGARYERPIYSWLARQRLGASADYEAIFWFDPRQVDSETYASEFATWPADATFRTVEQIALRGAFDSPDATGLVIHGGANSGFHTHRDLGNFVLDALGERWAVDMGYGDRTPYDYFDGSAADRRYSTASRGHNVVLVHGAGQDPVALSGSLKPASKITFFSGSNGGESRGIIDLTYAWSSWYIQRAQRGVALLADRQRALIVDEYDAPWELNYEWLFQTWADVTLDGERAVLEQNGKRITLVALSPEGAEFEVTDLVAESLLDHTLVGNSCTLYCPEYFAAVSLRQNEDGTGAFCNVANCSTSEAARAVEANWVPCVQRNTPADTKRWCGEHPANKSLYLKPPRKRVSLKSVMNPLGRFTVMVVPEGASLEPVEVRPLSEWPSNASVLR